MYYFLSCIIGVTIGAKTTWDQLTRGFCNALKRKNRKSGNGSANKKEWKFQEDMMFLIPAKKSRAMPGYVDPGMESDESERSFLGTSVDCNVDDVLERTVHFNKVTVIDGPVKKELKGQEEVSQMKLAVTKLLNLNSKRDELIKDEDELFKCFQQHQEKKCESQRMSFFKSIMPQVDALSDNDFLDFQVEVLQMIQRKRARPEIFHQHTWTSNHHHTDEIR